MEQEIREKLIAAAERLIAAPSCCAEAKAAGEAFLAAAGTPAEDAELQKLTTELAADIMPIDGLISFAESEAGAGVFGDAAKAVAAHAKERKAAGEAYCDCPACAACAEILKMKNVQ